MSESATERPENTPVVFECQGCEHTIETQYPHLAPRHCQHCGDIMASTGATAVRTVYGGDSEVPADE